MLHGYVIDFIHVHWGAAYFPAFNIADSAITIGAVLLILDAFREKRATRGDDRMKILLANPRGFCAGVDRAIDIVERALELFGAPIHVRHEVVHNRFVVDRLRGLGAVFVEELDEVPDGATVIFSAHGVSKAVQDEARRRDLRVFDATCPLVTKVHMEVVALRARRARRDPDRPRGPSGGRRHDGPVRRGDRVGASAWSRTSRTCSGSRCAIRRASAS